MERDEIPQTSQVNTSSLSLFGAAKEELRSMNDMTYYIRGISNPFYLSLAPQNEGRQINYSDAYVSVLSLNMKLSTLPDGVNIDQISLALVSDCITGMMNESGENSNIVLLIPGQIDSRGLAHFEYQDRGEDTLNFKLNGAQKVGMAFVLIDASGNQIKISPVFPYLILFKVYIPKSFS